MEVNNELLEKYNKFCESIEVPYNDELRERVANASELVHILMLGIPGEIGELFDLVKKKLIYGLEVPDYDAHLLEEFGDLFFFFMRALAHCGFTLDQVINANTDKLSVRFNEGKFTQKSVETRDLIKELEAYKQHI